MGEGARVAGAERNDLVGPGGLRYLFAPRKGL
jgi:hypothetical protein